MTEYEWQVFTNLVHYSSDLYQMNEDLPKPSSFIGGFADTMNDAIFEMIAFMVQKGIGVNEIERRMVAANVAPDVAHSYTHD